jgi:hypothetical protein
MSDYGSDTFEDAVNYYHQAKSDFENGQDESARSKLAQAKQIFQQCLGTHAEAKTWLAKTNQLLSQV